MRDTKPEPREDGPPCREESGVTFQPDFAAKRLAGLEVEVVSPVGDAGDLRAAMSDDQRAAISDQQCRRVVFFDELGVVSLPVEPDNLSLDLWPVGVSRRPAQRARHLIAIGPHSQQI